MMDFLKTLFAAKPDNQANLNSSDEISIAFAALLVEAARADENYETHEQDLITALLMKQFSVNKAEASALRIKGETAQANAIDLHQFTRSVKTLPAEEKLAFMEGLWRIVLSDGVRDPWEETLIRRVAGLIHITDMDSAKARQRVEATS